MLCNEFQSRDSFVLNGHEVLSRYVQVFENLDKLVVQKHCQRLVGSSTDFQISPFFFGDVFSHALTGMELFPL
jgi:hypothetical protein